MRDNRFISEIFKNALIKAYECAKAEQEDVYKFFEGRIVLVKSVDDYPHAEFYGYPVIFYENINLSRHKVIDIIESIGLIAVEKPETLGMEVAIKGLHKNVTEYRLRAIHAFVESLKNSGIPACICYTTDLILFDIKQKYIGGIEIGHEYRNHQRNSNQDSFKNGA